MFEISCEQCANEKTCNDAMDYPICLSSGECKYDGEKDGDFCYSLFEPKRPVEGSQSVLNNQLISKAILKRMKSGSAAMFHYDTMYD